MVSNKEFMRKPLSLVAAFLLLAGSFAFSQAKPNAADVAPSALPSDFSGWHKGAPPMVNYMGPRDPKILKEYGFSSFEQYVYQRGDRKINLKAFRFSNATGAFGAFTYFRTPSMAKENFCDEGASDGTHVIFYCTNVLIDATLDKVTAMTPAELRELATKIPRVGGNLAVLPKLPLHLSQAAQKNEHYISGPAGLDQMKGPLDPSLVDFSFSPEVVIGQEQTLDGPATILLVEYPTPKIAQAELQKMTDWGNAQSADWAKKQAQSVAAGSADAIPNRFATKRSGPIVAAVTGQIAENDARKILADINYDAEVTWNQASPTQKDNVANLIVNIMYLAFIIVGFMFVLGIAFGGFRIFMKKFFPGKLIDRPDDVEFIKLNLR